MGRTVRDTNLETRAARERLKARGKPHYRSIETGCHIGYRKGKKAGKWVARMLTEGKYRVEVIALADDFSDADGVRVLSWKQAQERARERCTEEVRKAAGVEPDKPYLVKDAIRDYLADYEARGGKSLADVRARTEAFIVPRLGETEVVNLTTKDVRAWHLKIASELPRIRSSKLATSVKYRDNSDDPDAQRKRRHSANKVLTILKAALNHAWHEGKVPSDGEWRRVKPFRGVDAPRISYLSQAECVRLVNACEPDFRKLVQAALFTGCRYGELINMRVHDFNPDAGTALVGKSKTDRPRHVVLTTEGQKFFEQITAGRSGDETTFLRADGAVWGTSHQNRRLVDACSRAEIKPRISFHILRHTYASCLVMNGVPLNVVAQNLGHADTRMTERHYTHLAPSYVADAIRAGAPELGITEDSNVETLRLKDASIARDGPRI